jgi:diguanylate cyclase (GGDEF)-like protein
MPLDTLTLRVAFAVVALTMLALFYLVTYRTTRSPYCGWWCASLALFVLGASAYLLNGTYHQVWANPTGNVLAVLGAGCVWAGARSLRRSAPARWPLLVAPAIVGLMSGLDDSATDVWAGGPFFLAGMWTMLALAAVELNLMRSPRTPGVEGGTLGLAVMSMRVACTGVAAYYLLRWVVFVLEGPDSRAFSVYVGSQTTTLILLGLLATTSVSMSTLSSEQVTAGLRLRATRDDLTGLLNRTEFLHLADVRLRQGGGGQLVLADLDHFKRINDEQGHLAGDHVLVTFADACTGAVRASDLVCRYGGEEFLLLLFDASPAQAERVTAAIDERMRGASSSHTVRMPTVSYGIATIDSTLDLKQAIGRADEALYRAKAAGRNRSVHYATRVA